MPVNPFAQLFRDAAPYIQAFRGRRFVIYFSGEAVADRNFRNLLQDIALLHSLGIGIVLVHGARQQISSSLSKDAIINDMRVTSADDMAVIKQLVGSIRLEIEGLLGFTQTAVEKTRINIVSGNFITAKPYGVRNGVDYLYSGEVRRVHIEPITRLLEQQSIVLLSPIGNSLSGEYFNLRAEDLAFAAANALGADKLLYLSEAHEDFPSHEFGELSAHEVDLLAANPGNLASHQVHLLKSAAKVCRDRVNRVHFLPRQVDGALLQELFTRNGVGTMVTVSPIEGIRAANNADIPGILELIAPLEEEGILVKRSREKLEQEIDCFTVVERDGAIVACAALHPISPTSSEIACLAVDSRYRQHGRGDALLLHMEKVAKNDGVQQLFALSTRTMQWFEERGFKEIDVAELPQTRQQLYNFQRNSKVFRKTL